MVFTLIFSCLATPLRLAFVREGMEESTFWVGFHYLVDLLFLIDIAVIFNTAYYDEYFRIIENRK